MCGRLVNTVLHRGLSHSQDTNMMTDENLDFRLSRIAWITWFLVMLIRPNLELSAK